MRTILFHIFMAFAANVLSYIRLHTAPRLHQLNVSVSSSSSSVCIASVSENHMGFYTQCIYGDRTARTILFLIFDLFWTVSEADWLTRNLKPLTFYLGGEHVTRCPSVDARALVESSVRALIGEGATLHVCR